MKDTDTIADAEVETARGFRVNLGLEQADVCAAAPVAQQTLTDIERGEDVSTKSLRRVAEVYGIPAGRLLDGMDKQRALDDHGRNQHRGSRAFRLHSKTRGRA